MGKSIEAQIAEIFDKQLLELLKNGRRVTDEKGNVHKEPLGPRDLQVIRQSLKDLGISAIAAADNPIGSLVDEMKAHGLKIHKGIPELPDDDEEDLATYERSAG